MGSSWRAIGEPGETSRGHVAVREPNRRLATDLTTVWTGKDGTFVLVPTINCGCRSLLGTAVTKDQHGPAVPASVRQAFVAAISDRRTCPTDSSSAPTTGCSTPARTGATASPSGTSPSCPSAVRPATPSSSMIRTLKEELIWLRDRDSADEVRAAVEAWVVRRNEQRPHQALGHAPPAEYRAKKLGRPAPTLKLAA